MSKRNCHSGVYTGRASPKAMPPPPATPLKHGITSRLAAEQLARLEAALTEEFEPKTAMELLLVHELAQPQWRKDRTLQMENSTLDQFRADTKLYCSLFAIAFKPPMPSTKAYSELRLIQAERTAQQDRTKQMEKIPQSEAKPAPEAAEFVSQTKRQPAKTMRPQWKLERPESKVALPFDPTALGYATTLPKKWKPISRLTRNWTIWPPKPRAEYCYYAFRSANTGGTAASARPVIFKEQDKCQSGREPSLPEWRCAAPVRPYPKNPSCWPPSAISGRAADVEIVSCFTFPDRFCHRGHILPAR